MPEVQESLDSFQLDLPKSGATDSTVDRIIYCDAPVATTLHRAMAAALDWSIVLIGWGVFLGAFHFSGWASSFARTGVMALGAVLPVLAFAYGLLWVLLDTETCGMRWLGLRLVTFDGLPPERKQRLLRFAATCLSIATFGLGLVWALADEESLAWQDHMSRTFPSPRT